MGATVCASNIRELFSKALFENKQKECLHLSRCTAVANNLGCLPVPICTGWCGLFQNMFFAFANAVGGESSTRPALRGCLTDVAWMCLHCCRFDVLALLVLNFSRYQYNAGPASLP